MAIRFILISLALIASIGWTHKPLFVRKDKLSEYGFFKGNLSALSPTQHVHPYDLNMPLFSNYSEKLRFIYLPEGKKINYNDSVSFDFPQGTVLIKNFYYPRDFRKPEKGRMILETRLLVHEPEGWQAYPYVWNDGQTEAFYDPAGEMKEISYISSSGKRVKSSYLIPNKNQCKGCHIKSDKLQPIGPSARQLNRTVKMEGRDVNQLSFWQSLGLLSGLPHTGAISALARWEDASSGDLNTRARSYLDANCGHCHSSTGPASTSGLFLDFKEQRLSHLGVNKAPVAAGRGSGNLLYDIVPGDPDHSILLFRMKTNDPAIAMPEIGREQIHKEGVDLIAEWIKKNTFAAQ